jgi:hypothetical protein
VPIFFLLLSSGQIRFHAPPYFARKVRMHEASQPPDITLSLCSHSYCPKPLADVEIACREREELEECCRFSQFICRQRYPPSEVSRSVKINILLFDEKYGGIGGCRSIVVN